MPARLRRLHHGPSTASTHRKPISRKNRFEYGVARKTTLTAARNSRPL
jgi:hypothetical protein